MNGQNLSEPSYRTLKLNLLGYPEILIDERHPQKNPGDKVRALLFYLAANRRFHERDALARQFWPGTSPDNARLNLNSAISRLNQILPERLINEEGRVRLHPDMRLKLDTEAFEACFPASSPDQLETAIGLYRGPFLDHLEIPDSGADYQNWVQSRRTWLEQQLFEAFGQLARYHAQQQRYDRSLSFIKRWLTVEPESDTANACCVLLMALNDDLERAHQHDQRCRRAGILGREFRFIQKQLTYGTINLEDLYALLPAAPFATDITVPTHPRPFQVPDAYNLFVGRLGELEAIKSDFVKHRHQLYALVGMGGAGKSSLAARLAHTLQTYFPDGVLWADLGRERVTTVLDRWAEAYGLKHVLRSATLTSRSQAFRDFMADKTALIVLDDVPNVEAKLSEVLYLIPRSSKTVVLVTTRYHTASTVLAGVAQLRYKNFSIKKLARDESQQLLVTILGAGRVEAEAQAADELAALLDDLPLALEMTARQLAQDSKRSLRDEVREIRAISGLHTRNRFVRASFERTWQVLSQVPRGTLMQKIFPRLSVFEGRSFTRQAAAFITGMTERQSDTVITNLCQLSLVNREGHGRYHLHALLADFAGEKLDEQQFPILRHRLAAYYQDYARRHTDQLGQLDAEWSNITAGMQATYDLRDWSLLLGYAGALEQVMFSLGRFADMSRLYRWLCRNANDTDHNQEVIALAGSRRLADLYWQWGYVCLDLADYGQAIAHANDGLEICEELDDVAGIARMKYIVGVAKLETDQLEEAEPLLQAAYSTHVGSGDTVSAADVLIHLSDLAAKYRNFVRAKQQAEEALYYYREKQHRIGTVKALKMLSNIAIYQKDYKGAEKLCFEALDICNDLQELLEQSVIWYILAGAYQNQERFDAALEAIEKNILLAKNMQDIQGEASGLWGKARILARMEQYQTAEAVCQQSLQIYGRLNSSQYKHVYDWWLELQQKLG